MTAAAPEQTVDAMRRAPLKTFAAHADPFELDRPLQAEIAAHQTVLANGPHRRVRPARVGPPSLPPDRSEALSHDHAVARQARAGRRLQEATTRRRTKADRSVLAQAQDDLNAASRDVDRTADLVHNTKSIATTERQAVTARIDAETKTAEERAELRQAVRTIDDALTTTRAERVRQSLHHHAGSQLGQLLGPPPPESPEPGRLARDRRPHRNRTRDPADCARLRWSKIPWTD